MKKLTKIIAFGGLAAVLLAAVSAQDFPRGGFEPRPTKAYIVGGVRHGASFFPKADYAFVKPKTPGTMDFLHYHTYDEVAAILRQWAKDYPNLVDLYSVGQSFEGRDIWQITITNKSTGKDTDKPAMFVEGNRHAGEVTAAESALWLAHHILMGYGRDPEITGLVDTRTLYVRVKNNPDGSELYLQTAQSLRSTVRPYDDDRDGLLDEDPPEDLDGDGFILQVRRKVEPGKGTLIIDPADKTGRAMIRATDGKGDYTVQSEGIDNDGDGRVNEDGIGGLDLHRNYPENWRPMPGQDLTGRGWTQGGAGEYPLSEPETRYVVLFLLQHPNVSVVQTMDTSVPMLLHGPSTSKMDEAMFPEDLKIYRYFDQEGKKLTGYERAGDTYYDYSVGNRLNRGAPAGAPPAGGLPAAGSGGERGGERGEGSEMAGSSGAESPGGSPLFGHSPDFGYLSYGAVWYGDELWNGGRLKDYDGDGRVTTLEQLRYIDENLGGRYFKPWTKFNHPVLGEVEIGGFNPKFWSQNPPVELLEEWIVKEAKFNLFLYKSLPRLSILGGGLKPVKKEKDVYELTVTVANQGYLPTALKMADRIKIVRPDSVAVSLPAGVEIVDRIRQEIGYLQGGERKDVKFKVKMTKPAAGDVGVTLSSTRGGVVKGTVKIG
ncbi:MAG: M14 family metallopeptidase [Acidobacteriota bacterium]|nr:M14 family metallopeptidase [Acidobacteriota bacterium]